MGEEEDFVGTTPATLGWKLSVNCCAQRRNKQTNGQTYIQIMLLGWPELDISMATHIQEICVLDIPVRVVPVVSWHL